MVHLILVLTALWREVLARSSSFEREALLAHSLFGRHDETVSLGKYTKTRDCARVGVDSQKRHFGRDFSREVQVVAPQRPCQKLAFLLRFWLWKRTDQVLGTWRAIASTN